MEGWLSEPGACVLPAGSNQRFVRPCVPGTEVEPVPVLGSSAHPRPAFPSIHPHVGASVAPSLLDSAS